jgi:hypothetical protein
MGSCTTQQAVADGIGWSRVDVARYKALKTLKEGGAWDASIVPAFQCLGTDDDDDEGTSNVPTGTKSPFTERLLREILDLTAPQQLDLCQLLAKIRASIKVHLAGHRAPARQINEMASEKFAFALIDDFPESA